MQLYDATEDLNASSAAVSDVGSLQQDISELKAKVRMLKEEHGRIKSEVRGCSVNASKAETAALVFLRRHLPIYS